MKQHNCLAVQAAIKSPPYTGGTQQLVDYRELPPSSGGYLTSYEADTMPWPLIITTNHKSVFNNQRCINKKWCGDCRCGLEQQCTQSLPLVHTHTTHTRLPSSSPSQFEKWTARSRLSEHTPGVNVEFVGTSSCVGTRPGGATNIEPKLPK